MELQRPGDDDSVPVALALRWQADYCREAGSPVAAMILDSVRADVDSGGPLAAQIPATNRFGDLPGLRVMAAVHRLALERRAPRVAMLLPTLGGTAPLGDLGRVELASAVVEALAAHPGELHDSLQRTPQTNETGRAALLRAALSRLEPAVPVRLLEIGSSAGLNLRADHLPGIVGLEAGPLPPVAERVGCDLHPVDPATTEGRLLLTSYVWVDDVDRFERLRSALQVAADVPALVRQLDAVDFTASIKPVPGVTTVLWHSAMWLYLPAGTRADVLANLAAAGAAATPAGPLVHVSWEWDPGGTVQDPFALVVRTWDGTPNGGRPRLIARGSSHGSPASLVEPQWLDLDPLAL